MPSRLQGHLNNLWPATGSWYAAAYLAFSIHRFI